MARIIWDKRVSPTKTSYVSDQLGIAPWQLRDAIHRIKRRSKLRGNEHVIVYDDGLVTDENGDPLGNIYDEI